MKWPFSRNPPQQRWSYTEEQIIELMVNAGLIGARLTCAIYLGDSPNKLTAMMQRETANCHVQFPHGAPLAQKATEKIMQAITDEIKKSQRA